MGVGKEGDKIVISLKKRETKCKNIKEHVGQYALRKGVTAQTLKAYGEVEV